MLNKKIIIILIVLFISLVGIYTSFNGIGIYTKEGYVKTCELCNYGDNYMIGFQYSDKTIDFYLDTIPYSMFDNITLIYLGFEKYQIDWFVNTSGGCIYSHPNNVVLMYKTYQSFFHTENELIWLELMI